MTTKEQVIQAARYCGVEVSSGEHWAFFIEELESFYNLAYKAGEKTMQERAASYVEGLTVGGTPLTIVMGAIGDAIRALEVSK